MPTAPPRPCHVSTCAHLVTPTQPCAVHGAPPQRWPSRGRGSTWSWRTKRALVLRTNPYCGTCQRAGVLRLATQVDHITPVRLGGSDDIENLEGICDHHHAVKTGRESRVPRPAAV